MSMTIDHGSLGEQILNGVFKTFYIILLPIILVYKLLSWFIPALAREAGNQIVKITGYLIATFIVGSVIQYFFHFPLK